MEGKSMRYKKTQAAPKHDGRPPLQKAVRTCLGERRGYQSLRPDLKSIVCAAHKLPVEVAPPARVWRSLRAQLENEGILSRHVKGRLEEQTRFPMFRN
jgi:hypothetical protein